MGGSLTFVDRREEAHGASDGEEAAGGDVERAQEGAVDLQEADHPAERLGERGLQLLERIRDVAERERLDLLRVGV